MSASSGFQAGCSGGSSLQGSEMPDVGHQPFTPPGESACLVRSFPNASCPAREGGGLQEHVSASPIHLGMVLLTFVVESSSSDFQIFFRGK